MALDAERSSLVFEEDGDGACSLGSEVDDEGDGLASPGQFPAQPRFGGQHVLPRGAEYVAKLHAPVQTGVTKSEVPLPATLPYLPSGQSLQARAPGRLYEPLGHGPAHWREVAPGWLP